MSLRAKLASVDLAPRNQRRPQAGLENEGPHALPSGTKLNHYTILKVLGTGGFGTTYKAREELTDREVVIKELLPRCCTVRDLDARTVLACGDRSCGDFAEALGRFRAEARTASALHHPNIPEVLSCFEANGTGYLVMAYHEGKTLAELLPPGRVMSEAEMLGIVVPLIEGVAEIHRRGFLHRDISPENILVRPDKPPLLLDFGAAFQASNSDGDGPSHVLKDGYAPLEQYEGGPEGPWTDVHALGAVMFRCLMSRPPLSAVLRAETIARHRFDPMADEFAILRERCSPDVAFAIEAALRLRGHERPQTATRLRELVGLHPCVPERPEPEPAQPDGSDEPAPTLLLGRSPARPLGLWKAAQSSANAGTTKRQLAIRALAIGAAVAVAAGGTLYSAGSMGWTDAIDAMVQAARSTAERPKTEGAKPMPAASTDKTAAADAAYKREMMRGLAEYQRLMLEASAAEDPRLGEFASPGAEPTTAEPRARRAAPSQRWAVPRREPVAAPPSYGYSTPRYDADRQFWQQPGYTAR